MKESTALIIAGIVMIGARFAPAEISSHTWRLTSGGNWGQLRFTIERSKIGSRWSNSSHVPLDHFRGLAQETIDRGGAAKFEYVHDAGRLLCEGHFLFGRGSGTYTFTANPDFASRLRRLGYDTPDEDQMFSMVMSDVSLEFVQGVRDAGVDASARELIDMRIHGATPGYLKALREAGYDGLRPQEITQLRIHGVPADFIRESKLLGYNFTAKELTDLRIHGVNAEYLKRLRDTGMRNLTAAQIAKLRIHGVN